MAKSLIYSYDKKRDVLYISIGEPQEAIGIEIADEIFAQSNPMTKEIVGFTIVNFAKQFTKSKKQKYPSFKIPVSAKFNFAQSKDI